MRRSSIRLLRALVIACVLCSPLRAAPVVEFYNNSLDHYFISINAAEIADLDSGRHPGWSRTGLAFEASATQGAGQSAVCRLYIPPGFGDSHFYSASAQECSDTRAKFPFMTYESAAVFFIALPNTVTGACPSGTTPVYRVWNNRADSNHRYTTNLAVVNQMLARGYVREGYGPNAVIMCAGSASAQGMDGYYFGTTSQNQNIFVMSLSDGRVYVAYSLPNSTLIAGMIAGNYTASGGIYTVNNARDFGLGAGTYYNVQVSGAYAPRVSISGTASYVGGPSTTFSATYSSQYEIPASLAAAAGTYSAQVGSTQGVQGATFTMSASGAFNGGTGSCPFSGQAVPRGATNVFDFTLTFGGALCPGGVISGAGFYDAGGRTIYVFGTDPGRTDGYILIGGK